MADNLAMGDVVRATLRELLPAAAESLSVPEGADAADLGASTDELRALPSAGSRGG